MKFVGEVMDGVSGIEWYSIVGTLIFVALFIVILIRTFKMPKSEIEEIKNGILRDDEQVNDNLK